jgi:two-component system, chemotaxis family, chemotaxis protein CheY
MSDGTILVVEDDVDIRECYQSLLEREGYRVTTAQNGQEALDVLSREHPSLILLDLMMPVMSGPEFLEAMRLDSNSFDIPVVIVSAYGELADATAGVAGFLRKPVDLPALLGTVRRFCPAQSR